MHVRRALGFRRKDESRGITREPMHRLRWQKLEVVVPLAQGEMYRTNVGQPFSRRAGNVRLESLSHYPDGKLVSPGSEGAGIVDLTLRVRESIKRSVMTTSEWTKRPRFVMMTTRMSQSRRGRRRRRTDPHQEDQRRSDRGNPAPTASTSG
jgi:hypothetical protein